MSDHIASTPQSHNLRPTHSTSLRQASSPQSLRLIRSNEVATSTDAALAGANLGVQYIHRTDEKREKEGGIGLENLKETEEGKLRRQNAGGGEVEWTYPDGGWRAWKVVFACFIFCCSQFGYGLVWGGTHGISSRASSTTLTSPCSSLVLVAYLHENNYKDLPLSTLNLVVGLSNFTMNGASFLGGRMGDKFGYKRMIAIGGFCTFISFVISALTFDRLPLIFIFQGFFLGISQGMAMPLVMSAPSQWFLKKRGLATGIALSGSGFGGGIASLLLRGILPSLGYRNALLVYAGINAVVWIAACFLLEMRTAPLRPGETRLPKNWLPLGVWSDVAFYSLMLCIAVGIFGYLTPYYFLTTYTQLKVSSLEPQSIEAALPLVMANFASGFGRIFAGLLADKIGPVNTLFTSFFIGGLLQLVFWPHAMTYGSIMAFGICYGFAGSWFMSLLPVAAAQLFGLKGLATITGFAVLCNSPGQFLGATISGIVLTGSGGQYPALSYYSGGMMLAGSIVLLPARWSREGRIWAKF